MRKELIIQPLTGSMTVKGIEDTLAIEKAIAAEPDLGKRWGEKKDDD